MKGKSKHIWLHVYIIVRTENNLQIKIVNVKKTHKKYSKNGAKNCVQI